MSYFRTPSSFVSTNLETSSPQPRLFYRTPEQMKKAEMDERLASQEQQQRAAMEERLKNDEARLKREMEARMQALERESTSCIDKKLKVHEELERSRLQSQEKAKKEEMEKRLAAQEQQKKAALEERLKTEEKRLTSEMQARVEKESKAAVDRMIKSLEEIQTKELTARIQAQEKAKKDEMEKRLLTQEQQLKSGLQEKMSIEEKRLRSEMEARMLAQERESKGAIDRMIKVHEESEKKESAARFKAKESEIRQEMEARLQSQEAKMETRLKERHQQNNIEIERLMKDLEEKRQALLASHQRKLEEKVRLEKEAENSHRKKREDMKVRSRDMMQFYDLVVDLEAGFTSICRAEGWVLMRSERCDLRTYKGPIVCVRGSFNKGKTFVLNLLANCDLPSGTTIHTKGLSFKQVTFQQRNMVFLDTAGSASPLASISEESIQEKKAEEDFLRDVSFHMADMFIEVVGEINIKDQTEIFYLTKDLKKHDDPQRVFRKVIVIHNLRDVKDLDEYQDKILEIKKLYPESDIKHQEVEVNGAKQTVEYLDGVVRASKTEGLEYQMHFWIAQDGTPAGYLNPFVAAKVMQIINCLPLQVNEFDVVESLRNAMRMLLGNFLEPNPTDVEIDEAGGKVLLANVLPRAQPLPSDNEEPSAPPRPPYILRHCEDGSFLSAPRLPRHTQECGYQIAKTDTELFVFVPVSGAEKSTCMYTIETKVLHPYTYHTLALSAESRCPVSEAIRDKECHRFDFGKCQAEIKIPSSQVIAAEPKKVSVEDGLVTFVFDRLLARKPVMMQCCP